MENNLALNSAPPENLFPSIIIPQPFSLTRHSQEDIDKLVDEAMSKVSNWETVMNTFFQEYQEFANSWRMIPRRVTGSKPRGLFNSKSGETNRATNTLASLWFRMLTSGDPYFEARAMGLDEQGNQLDQEMLYAAEGVLQKQLQVLQFKRKLFKTLRSLALFGTVIVEEPWVSLPIGANQKNFEGTDFIFRSLLQTAFDPYVYDLDYTDFIATIDYPTKFKLRDMANMNGDVWDQTKIEDAIAAQNSMSSTHSEFKTTVWTRVTERKQRAGYQDMDKNIFELINYHGKLDSESPILQDYWETEGRQDDIRFTDWTLGILNSKNLVRIHTTPFGTWKHIFKIAHSAEFELEPVGYGVGKIGKRQQRELDVTQSRANDALMMGIYTMHKVGKYAGLKSNQLNIRPFGLVELEDINQLESLKIDFQAIVQALAMQGILKEDFRTISQATTNLQAQNTGATATEASLTQTEAIRGNSVIAEIIAETLLREHLNTCHVNNTELLDNEIWIEMTGDQKPPNTGFNRFNLPRNIGFWIKVVTDKDFRPDRLQRLLEGINLATSVRQILPTSLNVVEPLLTEWFRGIGISPRLLRQQVPVMDQVTMAMQRSARMGGGGSGVGNEVASEPASENSGAVNIQSTPVGPVPTSPNASSSISMGV